MSENETVEIKNGKEEQEVTLADIAGFDMAEVVENEGGFTATPKGVFDFVVKDGELKSITTKNGQRGIIEITLEVTGCHVIQENDDFTEETVIGLEHREGIFISEIEKSLGQVKAIMTNAGYQGKGSLQELLDGFCGHAFTGVIKQRKDKDDTDKIYSNLVIKKITPLLVAEEG